MRIGIVCPYSFDAPGGVQFHVRDLATWLDAHGHEVNVLAPAEDTRDLPHWVVPAGKSVPISYNGSVARLSFGPGAVTAVKDWLGSYAPDVVHIHEPLTPSLGLICLAQAKVPIVATFHSNQARSRALWILRGPFQPFLDAITAPIAVSAEARRTIVEHLGANPVIIPNGVDLAAFRADPRPEWAGRRHTHDTERPVLCFLSRLDEPRKGLDILAAAVPDILEEYPGARVLIGGQGEAPKARAALAPFGERVQFLGGLSEADKVAMFASSDIYIAPQTGGESFGIVLVEAMAAGAHVIASDLQAFRDVLDHGRAGDLFTTNDPASLTVTIQRALKRRPAEVAAIREHASAWCEQYDWSSVGRRILATYSFAVQSTGAMDRDHTTHRFSRGSS
ncbi:MAG: glycosyltransferase family 4 protein [Bowdeniella nasicola]|nr:glycosyltransferase family 4 protein [Bowdeniella nasicola]